MLACGCRTAINSTVSCQNASINRQLLIDLANMPNRKSESDDDSSYRSEEGSDFEIEIEDLKKEKASKEKKAAACGASKGKKPATEASAPPSKGLKSAPSKSRKRKTEDQKSDEKLFDDLESTLDISDTVPSCKRVKVSPSLMIESRLVDVKDEDSKRTFSYPAIVFLRRTKDGKIFEFNMPASLASKIVEAVTVVAIRQ